MNFQKMYQLLGQRYLSIALKSFATVSLWR